LRYALQVTTTTTGDTMTTTNHTEPGQLADPFGGLPEPTDNGLESAFDRAISQQIAHELRAMAAKFTGSATSKIDEKTEDYGVGVAVRYVYGKCATELNLRADELAGGAR
jgi:hypothetical protein